MLGGCLSSYHDQGVLLTPQQKDNVKLGQPTTEILKNLGTPSCTSPFQKTWYYVSQRKEVTAFFTPVLLKNDILALSFSSQGNLDKIEEFTLKDAREVKISERTTPVTGHHTPLMKQIFRNLGRVSPGMGQNSRGP